MEPESKGQQKAGKEQGALETIPLQLTMDNRIWVEAQESQIEESKC